MARVRAVAAPVPAVPIPVAVNARTGTVLLRAAAAAPHLAHRMVSAVTASARALMGSSPPAMGSAPRGRALVRTVMVVGPRPDVPTLARTVALPLGATLARTEIGPASSVGPAHSANGTGAASITAAHVAMARMSGLVATPARLSRTPQAEAALAASTRAVPVGTALELVPRGTTALAGTMAPAHRIAPAPNTALAASTAPAPRTALVENMVPARRMAPARATTANPGTAASGATAPVHAGPIRMATGLQLTGTALGPSTVLGENTAPGPKTALAENMVPAHRMAPAASTAPARLAPGPKTALAESMAPDRRMALGPSTAPARLAAATDRAAQAPPPALVMASAAFPARPTDEMKTCEPRRRVESFPPVGARSPGPVLERSSERNPRPPTSGPASAVAAGRVVPPGEATVPSPLTMAAPALRRPARTGPPEGRLVLPALPSEQPARTTRSRRRPAGSPPPAGPAGVGRRLASRRPGARSRSRLPPRGGRPRPNWPAGVWACPASPKTPP